MKIPAALMHPSGDLRIRDCRPSQFYFYPNPVRDRLLIRNAGQGEIEVWNTKGELMFHSTYRDERGVDMRSFPSGIYVLKIIGQNGLIHTGKVLKE
jgi:hypothetical protein